MLCRICSPPFADFSKYILHKWQFLEYGWPSWILIQTQCPAIIFSNISWAKSHNFFIMQKSKFTERHNICLNWLLLQSIKRTCYLQMLSINVNVEFCIMTKLWDLAHEKLVNMIAGHSVWINIHDGQPYPGNAIYVLKSANGGLFYAPLYYQYFISAIK